MDRAAWIDTRRRRYLAQVLSDFEKHIEPLLSVPRTADVVQDFKGAVRAKLYALQCDAIDVWTETERGTQINAHAQELKDRQG